LWPNVFFKLDLLLLQLEELKKDTSPLEAISGCNGMKDEIILKFDSISEKLEKVTHGTFVYTFFFKYNLL
jgi:hypothetical protein